MSRLRFASLDMTNGDRCSLSLRQVGYSYYYCCCCSCRLLYLREGVREGKKPALSWAS